jgi:hypothetical protein
MALTLETQDTHIPTVGDWDTLVNVVGPKVFSAAFGLSDHDGSVVSVRWRIEVYGSLTVVWTDTFTVDVATQGGYLTPPIPVYMQAVLDLSVVSGSTNPIGWDVYAL